MYYRCNEAIEVRAGHSMVYLYDTRSKMCHVLNQAGLEAWEYLQQPHTISELVEHLSKGKNSSDSVDVVSHFIDSLSQFNLVQVMEEKKAHD